MGTKRIERNNLEIIGWRPEKGLISGLYLPIWESIPVYGIITPYQRQDMGVLGV